MLRVGLSCRVFSGSVVPDPDESWSRVPESFPVLSEMLLTCARSEDDWPLSTSASSLRHLLHLSMHLQYLWNTGGNSGHIFGTDVATMIAALSMLMKQGQYKAFVVDRASPLLCTHLYQ